MCLQRVERCDRRALSLGRFAEVERALRGKPLDLNQRLEVDLRFACDRAPEPRFHGAEPPRLFL